MCAMCVSLQLDLELYACNLADQDGKACPSDAFTVFIGTYSSAKLSTPIVLEPSKPTSHSTDSIKVASGQDGAMAVLLHFLGRSGSTSTGLIKGTVTFAVGEFVETMPVSFANIPLTGDMSGVPNVAGSLTSSALVVAFDASKPTMSGAFHVDVDLPWRTGYEVRTWVLAR